MVWCQKRGLWSRADGVVMHKARKVLKKTAMGISKPFLLWVGVMRKKGPI